MMKYCLPFLSVVALVGCNASQGTHPAQDKPVAVKQAEKQAKKNKHPNYAVVVVGPRVKAKCQLPKQPSPLARPLPLDSPKTLIDRLTAKLVEWVEYGNKVERVC